MSEKIQFGEGQSSSKIRGVPIVGVSLGDEIGRGTGDQLEAFVVATRKFETLLAAERKKTAELQAKLSQLETEKEMAARSLEESTRALQMERSTADGRKSQAEARIADQQKKLAVLQGQAEAYWKKIHQQARLIENQTKEIETYKRAWGEMQETVARNDAARAKSEEENGAMRVQVQAMQEAHKDLAVELERERTLRVQLQFHSNHSTKMQSDIPEIRGLFSALNNRMNDIQRMIEQQATGLIQLGDDSQVVKIHQYLEYCAQVLKGLQKSQREGTETLAKSISGVEKIQREEVATLSKTLSSGIKGIQEAQKADSQNLARSLPNEIGKLQAGLLEVSSEIKRLQGDKKMALDAQRQRSANAMRDLLAVKESEIATLRARMRRMNIAGDEYDRVQAVLDSMTAQRDELKALIVESEKRAAASPSPEAKATGPTPPPFTPKS